MPGDSDWWSGLTKEEWVKFNGVNESISPEDSLKAGQTDQADGFSFHGGTLRTDFFGKAALHFGTTRGEYRNYGIIPAISKGKFYTVFSSVSSLYGGGFTTVRDYLSMFDMSKTNIDTVNPKFLISDCVLNGLVITADGAALRKMTGSTIVDDLVRVPAAPTFNSDSGTGLTGSFYYRVTLVDANGNETGGGDVSAVRTVTDKTINPAIDITGFDAAVKGYAKIRTYRSINQTTVPADLTQVAYYYLGSSTDITIVPATTSYTLADSKSDTDLVLGAPLPNANPVTKATQAFFADICFAFQNRLVCLGTTENGTYYKNRVRWSDITDSTTTAVGNPVSFHADDYNDLDASSNDPLIGGFVMGGNGWVSSGDRMFSMTPTYSTTRGQQFAFAVISGAVGMYHHSCVDCGGVMVGRTRNGLARFNGSAMVPIAHEIYETMGNLAFPEADVAVFDYTTKRYYLTCYDTRIQASNFNNTANAFLVQIFRNTLIVYDFTENKIEIHPKTFIQYMKKLEDTNNVEKIFWAGNSGDVGMFTSDSFLTGPAWSFVGTAKSKYTINTGISLTTPQTIGKKLNVIAYLDAANSKIMFIDYKNDILSVSGNVLTLDSTKQKLPFWVSSDITLICAIDAASGTSTTGTSKQIVDDGHNYFKSSNLDFYMGAHDQGANGQTYGGVIERDYITVTSGTILTFQNATGITSGNKYVLIPFNTSAAGMFDGEIPSHKLLTPAFGGQSAEMTKQFHHFLLKCMGSGILRVRTFLDNQTTADQTKYLTLANPTRVKAIRVDLRRPTALYLRVELTMWKGTGWVQIYEASGFYKAVGGLRK